MPDLMEELIARINRLEARVRAMDTREYTSGGGSGTDADAIHDNVAYEISSITAKNAPLATSDIFLIEDSAASGVKKRTRLTDILNGWSHNAGIDTLRSIGGQLLLTGPSGRVHFHEGEMYVWPSGTPTTPSAGYVRVWINASGQLQIVDSAGATYTLTFRTHDHTGGDGAQIDHDDLANIGTNTHAQIDTHLALTTTAHGGVREKLSAARTYYVRTDGNDSNDGLSNTSGGAFLTIQKAVDTISGLDINGQIVTIQVADGTYTNSVSLRNVVGYAATGNLVIQGNSSNPGNVVISTTSANCFDATGLYVAWDIRDMKLQTTTSGYCLYALFGSVLRFQNLIFGACANGHIGSTYNATIFCTGNYSISGGAQFHAYCNGSKIIIQNRTIGFTANVGITYFAYAQLLASIVISGNTYNEAPYTCTGAEYVVISNSVIFTSGAGAGYLPGTTGGTASTGGQYI